MTAMGLAAVRLGATAPDSPSRQPAKPHAVQVEYLAAASITVLVMMHDRHLRGGSALVHPVHGLADLAADRR